MSKSSKATTFFVETIYGATTRQPLVRISVDGELPVQISPQEATAIALNLLKASQAALTDDFLIEFLEKRVGSADHEIVGVVGMSCALIGFRLGVVVGLERAEKMIGDLVEGQVAARGWLKEQKP